MTTPSAALTPIPVSPDWRRIVIALRKRFRSDDSVACAIGREQSRSAIASLATGRSRAPTWSLGAALLNLHNEMTSPPQE